MNSSFVSHSQNGEDIVLWRALGRIHRGFWIDVGANDPDIDSVTRAFSDAGWTGINVEPLPEVHDLLCERRPNDINLCVALGDSEGESRYFEVTEANGLSTSDGEAAARYRQAGLDFREFSVSTRTLSSVWDEFVAGDVHFLKIDVEGAEELVLQGTDLGRHRPWIVVVESVEPVVLGGAVLEPGARPPAVSTHEMWEHLIVSNGYTLVLFDGLNRFYVANERLDELGPWLASPVNVLDGAELASSRRERLGVETRLAVSETRVRDLERELEGSRAEVDAVLASKSWRITAPLRAIRRM